MSDLERYPSYVVCVAQALSTSVQPMSIDALVDQVKDQRPMGKDARGAIYRALRQIYQAVPVAPSRYGWLSHLLQGASVRHPLTAEESRRGYFLLDELEHAVFFPQFFQNHRPEARALSIELMGGPVVRAEAAVERKTWSLKLGSPFVEWLDEVGGQGHDDIIITVRDAVAGVYVVRLQPHEARDEESIANRNLLLAQAAEDLVASTRRTTKIVPTWEMAALLIGRGLFADFVPPDDLHMVLQRHSSLVLRNGIGYSENDADVTSRSDMEAPVLVESDLLDEPFENSSDWLNAPQPGGAFIDGADEDDLCADYEAYLDAAQDAATEVEPLSHGDYHLLEAELETLIGLEQEFGYLLPDQQARLDLLADRLFLDPDTLRSDDQDPADSSDRDEPPLWQS